jgi:PPM family protein phosphatase
MNVTPDNAQHMGRRQEQQDAFGFTDPKNKRFARHGGLLAVVADGMGGMLKGSEASKIAVSAFIKAYEAKSPKSSIVEALEKAIQTANQAVVNLGRSQGLTSEIGTTLVAAVIKDDSLYWISAGDSRIYLLRDGELIQLTNDHTYANELVAEVARGNLTRSEILTQTGLEDLTSYLGLAKLKELDRNIRPFPLQDGDCVLLCSDGLYKSLSDEERAALLTATSHKPCEALVNQVLEKRHSHQDNVTVLTLSCTNDALQRARRNKWAPGLAALLFTLAIIFGIWLFIPCQTPPPIQPQEPPVTDSILPVDADGVKAAIKKQRADEKAKTSKRKKRQQKAEGVKR